MGKYNLVLSSVYATPVCLQVYKYKTLITVAVRSKAVVLKLFLLVAHF
jgi:hypothetical protein